MLHPHVLGLLNVAGVFLCDTRLLSEAPSIHCGVEIDEPYTICCEYTCGAGARETIAGLRDVSLISLMQY